MDERKVDLQGTYYQDKYKSVESFKMYIDKRKKRNNKYLIIGEIKDKLGLATFQGTISRKFIKFIKMYDINALQSNAAEYLYYKGRWVNKEVLRKNRKLDVSNTPKDINPIFIDTKEVTMRIHDTPNCVNMVDIDTAKDKKADDNLEQLSNFFKGVFLFSAKGDPETKKHIDLLIETHSGNYFEIEIVDDSLKKDLINLGKL